MIDLLKTSTLTITPGAVGDFNEEGLWVDNDTQDAAYLIEASVQPFWRQSSSGEIRKSLPQGVSVEDVRVLYTKTKVNTATIVGKAKADTTIIDGLKYYAYIGRDWSSYGLDVCHYEFFFVRVDESRI